MPSTLRTSLWLLVAAVIATPAKSAVLLPPAAANLASGMVAGAIGVGVAYPLDTIKVKVQNSADRRASTADSSAPPPSSLALVMDIVREDGVRALYGGVRPTMLGQAVIKGVAFFAYEAARSALGGDETISTGGAVLAACASGGAAALVSTPVERVKVVMQASRADEFATPVQCVEQLVEADGWRGALFRGLGATLVREVPSYGLYFVSYEVVAEAVAAAIGGEAPTYLAPLIGGAAAGAMSWLPVYPVDVIKTSVQSELDGGRRESMVGTARRLFETGGIGIFWDGLTPKLLRAVVNHAVTFAVFEELSALLLNKAR